MRKLIAVLAIVGLLAVAVARPCLLRQVERRQGRRHADRQLRLLPRLPRPGSSPTRPKAGRRCTTPTSRCSPTPTPTARRAARWSPASPRAMPKITNGGKTYTLDLRKGLKYSDGTPVKASDFTYAVERMFKINSPRHALLHGHRRRRKVRRNQDGRHPRDRNRRQDRQDRHPPDQAAGHLRERARPALRRPGARRDAGQEPLRQTRRPPPAPTRSPSPSRAAAGNYERNPQWTKNNAQAPAGPAQRPRRQDRHHRRPQRVDPGQRRRTGPDELDADPPPADRYAEVKEKYEGTQFRVEPTISTYYFWMNTTKAPFDDLKVRQAVNYAIDPAAIERIYAGQLAPTQQILPPAMPGYKKFDLYPYDMAQGEVADQGSEPLGPRHHRLDRQRKPQRRSRRLLRGRARRNSASTRS